MNATSIRKSYSRSHSHSHSSHASFDEDRSKSGDIPEKRSVGDTEKQLVEETISTSGKWRRQDVILDEKPREIQPQVDGPRINRRPVKAKDVLVATGVVLSFPLRAVAGVLAMPVGLVVGLKAAFDRAEIDKPNTHGGEFTWEPSHEDALRVRKYDKRIVLYKAGYSDESGAVKNGVKNLKATHKIDNALSIGDWGNSNPESDAFSGLTLESRLDFVCHGTSNNCGDLSAAKIADRLESGGLREVGLIKLHSCNAGSGSLMEELAHELDQKGIKFGWISGTADAMGDMRNTAKFGGHTYTWGNFAMPWHKQNAMFVPQGLKLKTLKGNANVDFKGTLYNSSKSKWRIASNYSPFH